MLRLDGVCPGCKKPMVDHLRSSRSMPTEVGANEIPLINGRCYPEGDRAPQKCSWVQLAEPMDVETYQAKLAAGELGLEACPGCGGELQGWGQFKRKLYGGLEAGLVEIELMRGKCCHDDCPVCTVTHYPWFVTPYRAVQTQQRELEVRAYAEEHQS